VDDHTISIDKELESATTVHSEDSGYSDTDATDGEEEEEEEEEEGGEVAEEEEEGSETTSNEEEEDIEEEEEQDPNAKIIKWSMPPRLHYIDSKGYNYKSLHQLLVNASKGYVDLNGVKLRLKVIRSMRLGYQNAFEAKPFTLDCVRKSA